MTHDQLMTRAEVARMLSVSVEQVARLERDGMPVFRFGTRTPRYDRTAVLEWAAQQKVAI